MSVNSTLETFFSDALAVGTCDFRVRASKATIDGFEYVVFYIHPLGKLAII